MYSNALCNDFPLTSFHWLHKINIMCYQNDNEINNHHYHEFIYRMTAIKQYMYLTIIFISLMLQNKDIYCTYKSITDGMLNKRINSSHKINNGLIWHDIRSNKDMIIIVIDMYKSTVVICIILISHFFLCGTIWKCHFNFWSSAFCLWHVSCQ